MVTENSTTILLVAIPYSPDGKKKYIPNKEGKNYFATSFPNKDNKYKSSNVGEQVMFQKVCIYYNGTMENLQKRSRTLNYAKWNGKLSVKNPVIVFVPGE